MALARAFGAIVNGVSGQIVVVEVDHSRGLPGVGMVGLPDASVSEAKHRAKTAIGNQQLSWPKGRITISLSPAEVRKHGAGLDLAIAIGVLGATHQIRESSLAETVFIGELGLDGSIRQVPGALSSTIAAAQAGFERVVVPVGNAQQCVVVKGIKVVSFRSLKHLIGGLDGNELPEPITSDLEELHQHHGDLDLIDVLGQEHARWALEVAAVGRHNMVMVGPPGVGKTLLAERLPGILPALQPDESLEVTAIHSLAGALPSGSSISRAPFEAPHHSASTSAIVGSVQGHRVRPGALTRAHRGVLFLDEAPEFARNALEALRQPLEAGTITLHRSHWSGVLPADFQLIMAANPCPCGRASIESNLDCTCTSAARRNYAQRLSGPLLDRMDINLSIPASTSLTVGDSTEIVAARVRQARERANDRFRNRAWKVNASIPAHQLRTEFFPESEGVELLTQVRQSNGGLRGSHRILRVAWSLADLAGHDRPTRSDIAMAIHLRERPGALAT